MMRARRAQRRTQRRRRLRRLQQWQLQRRRPTALAAGQERQSSVRCCRQVSVLRELQQRNMRIGQLQRKLQERQSRQSIVRCRQEQVRMRARELIQREEVQLQQVQRK